MIDKNLNKNKYSPKIRPSSLFLLICVKCAKFINFLRFEDIWKFKEDADNPHERYYKDMIEREKMVKIEQEIRNIVDEMMRSELELLQAAFDRDRALKGKKSKKEKKVPK